MIDYGVALFSAGKVGGIPEIVSGEWGVIVDGKPYPLSSSDLMFRGMAVYYKDGAPFQISPWGVKLGFQNMTFDTIERIPEMFWQCWYELEKGDQ